MLSRHLLSPPIAPVVCMSVYLSVFIHLVCLIFSDVLYLSVILSLSTSVNTRNSTFAYTNYYMSMDWLGKSTPKLTSQSGDA